MKRILVLLVTVVFIGCSKEESDNSNDVQGPTKYTLILQQNIEEGGTISTNPYNGSDSSNQQFEEGTIVTITSHPNDEYEFEGWTGSVESSDISIELVMDNNKSLTGNFIKSPPLFLDENGVTIKCQDWVEVGSYYELNGVLYEVIDETLFGEYIDNPDYDFSKSVLKNVKEMECWFGDCPTPKPDYVKNFNQNISHWDTSSVTSMMGLFSNNEKFNQDISNWDVSNVTDMGGMFYGPYTVFNRDISNSDVSKVENMSTVFTLNKTFNVDISTWDVSSVTNMYWMFYKSNFNQDLSNWDVSSVDNCKEFSKDTPQWTLPKPNFTNCNPN